MYSQCPICETRFRVTAATLRAAHGRAQCGHCGHEFDALDHLSDEAAEQPGRSSASTADTETRAPDAGLPTLSPAGLAEAEAELARTTAPGSPGSTERQPDDYHFSAEDIEKVFIDARDWQTQYGGRTFLAPDATTEPPAAGHPDVVVEEPQGVEEITLEGLKVEIESDTGESVHLEAEFDYVGDEAEYDLDSTGRMRAPGNVPDSVYPDEEEAPVDEGDETGFYRALIEGRELPSVDVPPAVVPHSAPAAPQGPPPSDVAPIRAEIRRSSAARWSAARRAHAAADDDLADLDLTPAPRPVRRSHRWLALGSLILALALAVQITHYHRQAIVRHPQAGEALRRVYALIGRPLSPNWDLDAFELRQWGQTGDVSPGAPLTVRARLSNRADHAQPYPLLRLEFEDRFGAAVAQRDFMPAEYLKSAPQAARQLAAGETTEAELSVVAPGGDAVGYTLDVCMREDAGRTRCAHGDG